MIRSVHGIPRVCTGVCAGVALALSPAVYATNGMNLEGYGPTALGMGGAGYATDNGSASTMINPAAIGLMEDGTDRVDVALGFLGPDITAEVPGFYPAEKSAADAFWMPAVGWVRRRGDLSYGVAVFAQGGMGTEYSGDSFLAAGTGETVRSEVGVGRFMVPLAYNATPELTIGGSIDFVWAGMDLKMAMDGATFADFVAELGGTQSAGTASGSMVDGLVQFIGVGALNPLGPVNWTRFDFSNNNDFTGEARGYGLAGKLGFTYKINDRVTVGATYHTKTNLGDLSTSNATVSMSANFDDNFLNGTWDPFTGTGTPAGTYTAAEVPITGDISIEDFQWPATFGVGIAVQATDQLLLAADVKRIQWSGVMEDFKMAFDADVAQDNPLAAGFGGSELDAVMFQDWSDQTVIALGAAYQATDQVTLRLGYNQGDNPVPDSLLNPLFPAIVERHVTGGIGYELADTSQVDFALSRALEKTATTGGGIEMNHSQWSWQIMYSKRF